MQTPAICDKIPPFPAPRRKRARNRAPHHRGKRAAPSAARAVTDAARLPSLRSLGQSPTARPRYPAQTKVKTRSAPFAPHREVWRAAALQRNPAPACRSKAPSRKTPTGRLWRAAPLHPFFRPPFSGEVRRARRPSELQSYRPALSGRSNVAEGANRARRSFHSLANIGVLRAAARSPCICSRLQVALPPSVATAHRAGASFRRTFGSLCASRNSPQG